mmetsp:Transcript_15837/g.47063  ORF Transcript_15837/g.47063 Transcript_15837/m.47063 type:complete len:254 (+) Transcript_15837:36-797(+)
MTSARVAHAAHHARILREIAASYPSGRRARFVVAATLLGVACARRCVPRGYEEVVGEAVEVDTNLGRAIPCLNQRHHAALRAAADGARHVEGGRRRAAARQNEDGEGRKLRIHRVDARLEHARLGGAVDPDALQVLLRRRGLRRRNRRAHVEQQPLCALELRQQPPQASRAGSGRHARLHGLLLGASRRTLLAVRTREADGRAQFVDRAERIKDHIVLAPPLAVEEGRLALVPGARVDGEAGACEAAQRWRGG